MLGTAARRHRLDTVSRLRRQGLAAAVTSRVAPTVSLLLALVACAMAPVSADESDRIAELLELEPGMHAADVGAGDGELGEAMARRLGLDGHLYLNEVDEGELAKLRRRLERSELRNMSLVEGEPDDARLPTACCQAILLRFVYHHMSHQAEMRASLRRSLRPGGLLLIIEMDDAGHGTPFDRLITEWTGDGFEVVSRHPRWQGNGDDYAVLLRRRG